MSYAPILPEPTLTDRDFTKTSTLKTLTSKNSNSFRKSKPAQRSAVRNARLSNSYPNGSLRNYPIIVHCHLCWDWVWQRPQQFVSRLSKKHKVLFVETLPPDPQLASTLSRFRTLEQFPNLTILSIQFPLWRWKIGRAHV